MAEVDVEILTLRERRSKLATLLSVSKKIDSNESLNDTERKQYMDAIHEEILTGLKNKHGKISPQQLDYLRRDRSYQSEEQQEFIAAIKRCLDFAKTHQLRLGPSRGSSSASIVLHALGLSKIDPAQYGLFPERLLSQPPNIHMDVEFARGQEFVDFCKETTRNLRYGQIQAFKMPLLDILNNVDQRLGKPVEYDKIDDNSDAVLTPFRQARIEKIFQFDFSKDALIMKFENFMPGYEGPDKITEYLQSQQIKNFRDVTNITALWRPFSEKMVARLELYAKAKNHPVHHECLSPELQSSLKDNFGMIIYHEDILRIISYYTQWDVERCNRLRQALFFKREDSSSEKINDVEEFKALAPPQVVDLILEESSTSFCLPHAIAYSFYKSYGRFKKLCILIST